MKRKRHELAILATDAYKLFHSAAYPEGTTSVYSNMTPRHNSYFEYDDHYVAVGTEMFIERFLINFWNERFFNLPVEEVVEDFNAITKGGGLSTGLNETHVRELHDLGYLPLEIKSLPEGTYAKVGIPMLTVENTDDRFYWLTNFIETQLLSEMFPVFNSSTIARQYKKIALEWSTKTCDNNFHIPWQFHDFSRRGQHGNDAGTTTALGHLTSFMGTDSIQGALMVDNYYQGNTENGSVYGSVMATEHSVASSYGLDGEKEYFKSLLEKFPDGILSMVSDTYDYWNVLENVLPQLKDEIMSRNGKLVLRPDSGKIIDVICGKRIHDIDLSKLKDGETLKDKEWEIEQIARDQAFDDCEGAHNCGNEEYEVILKTKEGHFSVSVEFEYSRHDKTYYYVEESEVNWDTLKKLDVNDSEIKGTLNILWDTFGGTINEKGYKVLDPRIGLIYGDSVNLDNAGRIFEAMESIGFASSNVVLGVGAYSYSYQNSRDMLATAFKTTSVVINGVEKSVQKDPKTDSRKSSAKGRLAVSKHVDGHLVLHQELSKEDRLALRGYDLLQPVFRNGERLGFTDFERIRDRIEQSIKL